MNSNLKHARPLVTFALFAYNQEKYIREAVEGAFSQTYQPLEIVLSDDCSTDRTFEIMSEMAASYEGPHSVKLNRNKNNVGVVKHVIEIGASAHGAYIVVCAGDDISKPHRTERLSRVLNGPNIWAVSSGYDLVDEASTVIAKDCRGPSGDSVGKYLQLPEGEHFRFIQGSTAAYKRSIFDPELINGEVGVAEDGLLTFYAYLRGAKVLKIDEPLVLYRMHGQALSNRPSLENGTADYEERSHKDCLHVLSKFKAFERLTKKYDSRGVVDLNLLREDIRRKELMAKWPEMGALKRVMAVVCELLLRRPGLAKWQTLRICGHYPYYQPRNVLAALRRRFT